MREDIKERIIGTVQNRIPQDYTKAKGCLYPNDWQYKKLSSELSENRQRNYDDQFSREDVLSVSGDFGIVNQIELLGRSYAGESVDNYHVVNTGDIVYTKSPLKANPYGIIKLNLGVPGIVSTLYAVYHCKNNIVGRYIDYYFQMDVFLNNYLYPLVKKGAKNDMKVNNEDVLKGNIAFPSIEEQNKIVEILNQCDKVIELKQQLIEEERIRKKWLMQNLLDPDSGVRLPGFAGRWKKNTLGNIGKFCGGGTPRTSESNYWDGTIPWVSSADIVEGDIYRIAPTRFITQEGIDNSATQICPKGSIIIVSRVGVGKLAIAPMELCTSQDFTNIVSMKANNIFLATLLQDILAKKKMQGQGTSIKGITVKEIKKMELHLPTIEEQNDIADLLFSQDQMIDLLEQELAQWQQKKKALMQLLLTGIVRVSV